MEYWISPDAEATAANMTKVPLRSGGVQLELHAGGMDIEIEIAPDGKVSSVLVSRGYEEKKA